MRVGGRVRVEGRVTCETLNSIRRVIARVVDQDYNDTEVSVTIDSFPSVCASDAHAVVGTATAWHSRRR